MRLILYFALLITKRWESVVTKVHPVLKAPITDILSAKETTTQKEAWIGLWQLQQEAQERQDKTKRLSQQLKSVSGQLLEIGYRTYKLEAKSSTLGQHNQLDHSSEYMYFWCLTLHWLHIGHNWISLEIWQFCSRHRLRGWRNSLNRRSWIFFLVCYWRESSITGQCMLL